MSLNCHVVSTWVLHSSPVFEKASSWIQRWYLHLLVPGTVISSERDNFIVLRAYSSPLTWRQRWPILFHNSLTSDSVVLKETSKSFFSFMLKPASSKCPSSPVTCDKNTSATPLCCRLPHIAVEETVRQRAQNARGRPKVNRGTWSKSCSYFNIGCLLLLDVTVSAFRTLRIQSFELEDAWFKEVEEREEVQLWEE